MKQIPFSPPDIRQEEIDEVVAVLKSGWITTGPKTKLFEQTLASYCGTPKVVCLNSATAGMELILRALGIGSGDEVITSAYTYTASASVIYHVGAIPVLVDVAKDSYHITRETIEKAITPQTKAIITIDLGGAMCDYDPIIELVEEYKNKFVPTSKIQEQLGRIAIIADAAHSLGAIYKGKQSGAVADFTSFSFHAVKNLTTGEGGAVTWRKNEQIDDEALYHMFMLLSLHGQNKDALEKTKLGAWNYDIVMPGYKCNMTDMMAALGLSQLKRYNEILKIREGLVTLYNQLLQESPVKWLNHRDGTNRSSFHLYLLGVENIDETKRNKIIHDLAVRGVTTNVHYKPLPMHTAYQNKGFQIIDYPNAYEMYKKEITLPLYTTLEQTSVMYIVDTLKDILNRL